MSTAKRSTRLAGHALPDEGRVYDAHGYKVDEAATACSCGESSPVLPNTAQRRKWHASHKESVAGGAQPSDPTERQ